jgi:hypothetical protein
MVDAVPAGKAGQKTPGAYNAGGLQPGGEAWAH